MALAYLASGTLRALGESDQTETHLLNTTEEVLSASAAHHDAELGAAPSHREDEPSARSTNLDRAKQALVGYLGMYDAVASRVQIAEASAVDLGQFSSWVGRSWAGLIRSRGW